MERYSTSFGSSTFLFPVTIRHHIYNIYGLVRIADEIVDSYAGPASTELLDNLELDVLRAIKIGYSANPIVHAFGLTMRQFNIDTKLVKAFFSQHAHGSQPSDIYASAVRRVYPRLG